MKVQEHLIREAQLLATGATNHETDQICLMYRGAAKGGHESQAAFEHFEQALKDHIVELRINRARTTRIPA